MCGANKEYVQKPLHKSHVRHHRERSIAAVGLSMNRASPCIQQTKQNALSQIFFNFRNICGVKKVFNK
jgi:hypothetical protein